MQNGFHHKSARSVFTLAHIATYTINTQEVLQDCLETILLSPNLTAYVAGLTSPPDGVIFLDSSAIAHLWLTDSAS